MERLRVSRVVGLTKRWPRTAWRRRARGRKERLLVSRVREKTMQVKLGAGGLRLSVRLPGD